MEREHSWRGLRFFVCTLAGGLMVAMLAPPPGGYALTEKAKEELKEVAADWSDQAKEAALKYADEKKDEFVKEKSKAAIFALYKKLYKSGASKTMTRALAEVALSAPELNKLAEETADAYGSGDPEKIREASEKVAVRFGEQISRLASNQETRKLLGEIIGSSDKVREISGVLGQAAAGTDEGRREAAKYLGELVISVTPAAGIVTFYQSAYGAMKYANDKFVDSQLEELYQEYKSGRLTEAGLKEKLDMAPYNAIVRDKMSELRGEKATDIADAARHASGALKEHLTNTTNDEVIGRIIASFDGRKDKEREDAAAEAERTKAEKEANTILEKLNDVASLHHGNDWSKTRSYDLHGFTSKVRDAVKTDGVLDPNNPAHLKVMSELLSTALVHGNKSKQYTKLLDELKATKDKIIATHKGAPCTDGSETERLAVRLWQKGRQLVAQKKVTAAIPVFKQSLEFCTDEDRAAQLAELIKLAKGSTETEVQKFDGTYVGNIQRQRVSSVNVGSLQLKIKKGQVAGSFLWKEADRPGSIVWKKVDLNRFRDGVVTRQATISGRVSEDGQITASVSGNSRTTAKSLISFNNCTFIGEFRGRIEGAVITASIVTRDRKGGRESLSCKYGLVGQAKR